MVCNPESSLVIIPVGLNYFHADRFRSRAVVEYGQPIKIPPDLISLYLSGGTLKRQAVGKLMHTIEESLKGLSLQAPDFESLVVVQAVNRLYCNDRELSIDASLRICRKFAFAFQEMRNHPEIIDLVKSVKHYNSMLNMYAIKDHQVKHTSIGPINALLLLIYRIIQIVLVFIFALPMYLFFFIFRLVLGSPLIYLAHSISRDKMIMAKAGSNVKIHGKDVVSTWMLLTSLVVIPVLWIGYSMLVYAYYVIYYERSLAWCRMIQFFIMYPFLGYATILAGDVGMDIAKSLKPLIVSVAGFFSSSEQLRDLRSNLQNDIERLVKKLGPQIFPGFEDSRHKDIDPDTSHDDDFTGSPERDEWNRLADTIAF
jgi:glycerol-3-phosphate O-acyltransferase/dihydroxyacetone phosphate acyltransferase